MRRSRLVTLRLLTSVLVFLAALMIHGAPRAQAAIQYTFYAAPTGSGTACSLATPCSLAGARDKVRTLNSSMSGDIVVSLRGGTYQLSTTFALDQSDSGNNGFQVVYQAYSGETPTVSGGQTVTNWSQVNGTSIWQATVGTSVQTRQLYVNRIRATRAARGSGIPGSVTKTATGYTTTDTSLQSWSNPSDIEFVYTGSGSAGSDWTESRCGVAGITGDANATTITMDEPCWTDATVTKCCGQNVSFPNGIENTFQLLDQPGEWYLNRGNGTLYYIPRSGEIMTSATVVIPTVETLVSGTGIPGNPIHNVQFKGITFAYATWLAPSTGLGFVELQANWLYQGNGPTLAFAPANIFFHTAQNIRFERNTFTHLGAQGLAFDRGSQNNIIIGNVFTDISGTAVRIGTVDAPTAVSSVQEFGNVVSNNYIHDIAVEFHGGVGLMGGYTANTSFTHNEIANVPYSGISLGWGWGTTSYAQNNEVDHNLIHDHMQRLADGGGIYTLSEQAAPDGTQRTRIHDNYIYNQGGDFGSLYPDEGSAAMDWYSNVVANTPRWLHIWTGSINNLYVHDNFSDTSAATTNGSNITYANNYTNGTPWPSAAQAIIAAAGIEAAYQNIKVVVPPVGQQINLALSKTTSASSEYSSDCGARKANNGSTDAADSCGGWSPTGSDANPWLQVDLGVAYRITSLELVTRQNCCDNASTRQDFAVQASNDPTFATYSVLGSHGSTPLPYQATWLATVTNLNSYRYIRATKSGYFFIAELRVFGTVATPTNVALNKPATASSVYAADCGAGKANNGSIDAADSCGGWSPTGSDANPWLQVDLGVAYRITSLELVTRQNCCDNAATRQDFEVRGSNDPTFATYSILGSQGSTPLPYQATWAATVSDTNSYRYIRATKVGYFFIAELRVFGTP